MGRKGLLVLFADFGKNERKSLAISKYNNPYVLL